MENYPAWVRMLEELGYKRGATPQLNPNNYWKLFPIEGFVDRNARQRFPQMYLVRYRSFPTSQNYSITQVANSCGPGSVEIGLDDVARAETGAQRAKLHMLRICDPKWDTATTDYPPHEIAKALWLVASPLEPEPAWQTFSKLLPNYPAQTAIGHGRPFSKEERIAFCNWLKSYAGYAQ